MNNRLSLEFGQTYTRIPLETSPHIVHGDALEMDWADLLPSEQCSFVFGNPPFGGGSAEKRAEFIAAEPVAEPWVRPYVGAREYLQGGRRWILALHDAPPNVLAGMPTVRERIAAVHSYREASRSAPTRKLAETPTLYHVTVRRGLRLAFFVEPKRRLMNRCPCAPAMADSRCHMLVPKRIG